MASPIYSVITDENGRWHLLYVDRNLAHVVTECGKTIRNRRPSSVSAHFLTSNGAYVCSRCMRHVSRAPSSD